MTNTIENKVACNDRTFIQKVQKGISRTFYTLSVVAGISMFGSLYYGPFYNGLIKPAQFIQEHPEVLAYKNTQNELSNVVDNIKYLPFYKLSELPKLENQKKNIESRVSELKNLYPSIERDIQTIKKIQRHELYGLLGVIPCILSMILFGTLGEGFDPDKEIPKDSSNTKLIEWKQQDVQI